MLRALGTKNDARYNLKIVDVDRPGGIADEDNSNNAGVPTDVTTTPQNDVQSNPVEESTEEPVEENASVAARTRKELADMDDLDI